MKPLRYVSILFILLALGISAGVAGASVITYDLNATTSAGSLTGTVNVNATTGLVEAADLTFGDSSLGTPVFTTVSSTSAYSGLGQDWISGSSTGSQNYGGQAALFFDTGNLGSGGSLALCTATASCGLGLMEQSFVQVYSTHGDALFEITSGTLSQDTSQGAQTVQESAATPEPAALFLVGTGALFLAGLCQWKGMCPASRTWSGSRR